eukprot:scpid63230/ scgid19044/ 
MPKTWWTHSTSYSKIQVACGESVQTAQLGSSRCTQSILHISSILMPGQTRGKHTSSSVGTPRLRICLMIHFASRTLNSIHGILHQSLTGNSNVHEPTDTLQTCQK